MIKQVARIVLSLSFVVCALGCSDVDPMRQVAKDASALLGDGRIETVSEFLFKREILSSGATCHFQAVTGFCTERASEGVFYTTDALLSNLVSPDSLAPVGEWVVIPHTRRSDLRSYYAGYQLITRAAIVLLGRDILRASPLGTGQSRFFDYSRITGPQTDGRSRTVIEFHSKDEYFGRSLMDGGGRFEVDDQGYPVRLEVEDAAIYFDTSRRRSRSVVITPYRFIMEFGRFEEEIYCSSMTLYVKWRLPSDAGAKCYAIESNPLRNPFGNQIESITTLTMTGTKRLEKGVRLPEGGIRNDILFYTDKPDMQYWESALGHQLSKLRNDLGCDNTQLSGQTAFNIARHVLESKRLDESEIKKRVEENRKIYHELFRN